MAIDNTTTSNVNNAAEVPKPSSQGSGGINWGEIVGGAAILGGIFWGMKNNYGFMKTAVVALGMGVVGGLVGNQVNRVVTTGG